MYNFPIISDCDAIRNIQTAITANIPFSFTRLGDGEIHILNGDEPESLKQTICNKWNAVNYNLIKPMFIDIINNSLCSDMIGLMNPNNEVCKHLKYNEKKWAIPVTYINKINTNYVICDHQLPRSKLFGDIHNFKNIIQGNCIHIISPNIDKLIENNISQLLQVEVTYTKSTNNRDELLNSIKNIKPNIILYGCSLTGKDLACILKNQYGKIALDVGSLLDAWAGIPSRKWFTNGVQNYCMVTK